MAQTTARTWRSRLRDDPMFGVVVLTAGGIVVGAILALALGLLSHYLNTTPWNTDYFANGYGGDDVGSLLSGIVGSASTFAAALVAIVLAQNAVTIAKQANALNLRSNTLADQGNELNRRSNQIAQGERPEYEEAFKAAASYGAFKADLVLVPMDLRRLQREGLLEYGQLMQKETTGIALDKARDELVQRMIESSLLSVLPSLASKIRGGVSNFRGENWQRLFEALLLHVKKERHFVLAHCVSLQLVHEIDQLIEEAWKKVGFSVRKAETETYFDYLHALGEADDTEYLPKNALTELEFWFVRHAFPHTQIN